jgi:hypothetical protein
VARDGVACLVATCATKISLRTSFISCPGGNCNLFDNALDAAAFRLHQKHACVKRFGILGRMATDTLMALQRDSHGESDHATI